MPKEVNAGDRRNYQKGTYDRRPTSRRGCSKTALNCREIVTMMIAEYLKPGEKSLSFDVAVDFVVREFTKLEKAKGKKRKIKKISKTWARLYIAGLAGAGVIEVLKENPKEIVFIEKAKSNFGVL